MDPPGALSPAPLTLPSAPQVGAHCRSHVQPALAALQSSQQAPGERFPQAPTDPTLAQPAKQAFEYVCGAGGRSWVLCEGAAMRTAPRGGRQQ